MKPRPDDRVTVGLNAEGQKALDDIRAETPYFPDESDAYRFAIAYSIGHGLGEDSAPPRGAETKFNVGSLDRDGRLRALITAAFPSRADRPYAFAEQLAHAGLFHLRTQLVETRRTLAEVLAGPDETAQAADTTTEGPGESTAKQETSAERIDAPSGQDANSSNK